MNTIDFDLIIFSIIFLAATLVVFLIVNLVRLFRKGSEFLVLGLGRKFVVGSLWLVVPVLLFLSVAGFLLYSRFYNEIPIIQSSYPQTEAIWDSYDKPVEVTFNVPVNKNLLNPSVNPEIKGRWEWTPYFGITSLTRHGKFYPEETLFEGQRVVVYITGVKRPLISEGHELGFVFDSVKMPEIVSTIPYNKSFDVKQDQSIFLLLNKPFEDLVNLDFKVTPALDFDIDFPSNREVNLKPKEPLKQSVKYMLNVERKAKKINLISNEILEEDNPKLVHQVEFSTVREPLVKAFSPKGTGVKQDALIKIRFEVDVDRSFVEDTMVTEPNIDGTFEWRDDKNLTFRPTNPLQKGLVHVVKFPQGIKGMNGGVVEKEIAYEFETIGVIKVAKFTPSDNEGRVNENTNISVTFDQEVDHGSAEANFSLNPGIGGAFTWDGNTMTFNPTSSLAFNTRYTITLKSGIKTVFGLDSNQDWTSSFTVRSNQVVIQIPQFYQSQVNDAPGRFGCNIFAARMALAWKGYNLDPTAMVGEIGYNANRVNNQWTGNPYTQFVGTSNASWGYGVYWQPIQRLFSNRGIQTQIREGWNIRDLAKELENGHPVVIWRYNGESANYDINWTASDGTFVRAINGQHGGVVTGFLGTSDNPTHFHLNDPWYGVFWMQASTFDYYWSRLNRVGLIVY